MKLNVNLVENDIYTKICRDFAEYSESKLQRYRTVFEFLRVTDVERIITPTTLEVYKKYEEFCKGNGYTPLVHTVFSRTICECGFTTRREQPYKKKYSIYFSMC